MRDSRPDLSAQTDEQLLARAFSIQRHLRVQFSSVVWASMGSSVAPGILPALLGEVEPEAIAKLMAGLGDVDSAGIASQIFDMSRMVLDSDELTAAFDGVSTACSTGSRSRAPTTPSASSPRSTTFMYNHGAAARTSGTSTSGATRPDRRCCCRRSKSHAAPTTTPTAVDDDRRGAAERKRLIDKYEAAFADSPEALGAFQTAVRAASVWMAARERIKSTTSGAINEVRMCFDELGRRMVDAGHLAHARQIYMLLADELDEFVADPASFTATLAERDGLPRALQARSAVHRRRRGAAAQRVEAQG